MKREAVRQHLKNPLHEKTLKAKFAKASAEANQPSAIEKSFLKADEATLVKMDKLYRTAFYIARKERPFTDFKDLLDLQTLNGITLEVHTLMTRQPKISYFKLLTCILTT